MSRREFLIRVLLAIWAVVLVGVALLALSVFHVLDLEPATRTLELRNHVLYGLVVGVLASALILFRMGPVLRLLEMWDRRENPSPASLRLAQERAILGPNQFMAQVAALLTVFCVAGLYVNTQVLGRAFSPSLLQIALIASFSLGMGFVISVGLRLTLQPAVLYRIPGAVDRERGRFSIISQMALMTAVLSLILLAFGGAYAYASVVRSAEQGIADERARWLQRVAIPEALNKPSADQLVYLQSSLSPVEMAFYLDPLGQPAPEAGPIEAMAPERLASLAGVEVPTLYKQDFGLLRVLAVPYDGERTLCIAYTSTVGSWPFVRGVGSSLLVFSLAGLVLAIVMGVQSGSTFSFGIRRVARRLLDLAQAEALAAYDPISQTSIDEVGDLVLALNRLQQRTDAQVAELQSAVSGLESASEQQRLLVDSLVELTAPVIQVAEGLVVVPLVGHFDDERSEHIRPNLLAGIADRRARVVVIDLTGVSRATEALAHNLYRASRAAHLLGCRVVLTGAGPDVAWSLARIEGGLASLPAHRDLEQGLSYARSQL